MTNQSYLKSIALLQSSLFPNGYQAATFRITLMGVMGFVSNLQKKYGVFLTNSDSDFIHKFDHLDEQIGQSQDTTNSFSMNVLLRIFWAAKFTQCMAGDKQGGFFLKWMDRTVANHTTSEIHHNNNVVLQKKAEFSQSPMGPILAKVVADAKSPRQVSISKNVTNCLLHLCNDSFVVHENPGDLSARKNLNPGKKNDLFIGNSFGQPGLKKDSKPKFGTSLVPDYAVSAWANDRQAERRGPEERLRSQPQEEHEFYSPQSRGLTETAETWADTSSGNLTHAESNKAETYAEKREVLARTVQERRESIISGKGGQFVAQSFPIRYTKSGGSEYFCKTTPIYETVVMRNSRYVGTSQRGNTKTWLVNSPAEPTDSLGSSAVFLQEPFNGPIGNELPVQRLSHRKGHSQLPAVKKNSSDVVQKTIPEVTRTTEFSQKKQINKSVAIHALDDRQLRKLTDQVYSMLSKRLRRERERRGY